MISYDFVPISSQKGILFFETTGRKQLWSHIIIPSGFSFSKNHFLQKRKHDLKVKSSNKNFR